jgi:3-isopropylmalate/(R)-2-methylmalate dehydratase small subunit
MGIILKRAICMQAFTSLTSMAAPLPLKDVDTDMIIPAQHLTSISREGFGAHLFERLRTTIPSLFINEARYGGAQILIADANFGCGSSREHAVWALLGAGIRVVIAPSFADIFASNSSKNGLLLVTLEPTVVAGLLTEANQGELMMSVDLQSQTVSTSDGRVWAFAYDSFRKHCLLRGLDDMDYLRSHLPIISAKKAELEPYSFFRVGTPNR